MSINIILFIILINFFLFKINESVAKKINLYDIPNNTRKLHKKPTPLNGGIFYFVNLFLIFIFDIFFNNFNLISVFGLSNEVNSILTLLVVFSLLILGIIDDKISLKPISKSLLSMIIFFIYLSIGTEYLIIDLRFKTFNFTLDLFGLSLVFTILCFMTLQIIFNMYDGINLQSAAYYSLILLHLMIINQKYSLFHITLRVKRTVERGVSRKQMKTCHGSSLSCHDIIRNLFNLFLRFHLNDVLAVFHHLHIHVRLLRNGWTIFCDFPGNGFKVFDGIRIINR